MTGIVWYVNTVLSSLFRNECCGSGVGISYPFCFVLCCRRQIPANCISYTPLPAVFWQVGGTGSRLEGRKRRDGRLFLPLFLCFERHLHCGSSSHQVTHNLTQWLMKNSFCYHTLVHPIINMFLFLFFLNDSFQIWIPNFAHWSYTDYLISFICDMSWICKWLL